MPVGYRMISQNQAAVRFLMETEPIYPRWFVWLWDVTTLAIAGIATVGLAIQLNPAAIIFVLFGGFMIWAVHNHNAGLRDPERNFVELGPTSFKVEFHVPIRPVRTNIPYADVGSVEVGRRHGDFWLWPNLRRSKVPHVDVFLRRARLLPGVVGRTIPWVRVLHLHVRESDRFASELKDRIAASA